MLYWDERRSAEALAEHHAAFELWHALIAEAPHEADYKDGLADSLSNLGIMQESLGELNRAIESYKKSLAVRRELLSEGRTDDVRQVHLAHGLDNLSVAYAKANRLHEAMEAVTEALLIRESLRAAHRDVAGYQHNKESLIRDYSTHAGTVLRALKASGFFKNRRTQRLLSSDADLRFVREHLDDKALFKEQ